MKRQWIYLINPINKATLYSFIRTVKISTYHYNALLAGSDDVFINGLLVVYADVHSALMAAYNAWQSSGETQIGETLNLTELFVLLGNVKINKWDSMLQAVYPKGTPKYKSIMPHGHAAFQHGGQLVLKNAVITLSTNIGSDPLLATLRAEVDAFFVLLTNAFNDQKGKIIGTDMYSTALEAARVAMCDLQYADLGALIQHYATTPDSIDVYFDLETIRQADQVIYTHHMTPAETRFVVKHTFHAGDMIRLINMGNTELTFFLTHVKAGAPTATVKTLAPLADVTVPVEELGDLVNTYLKVTNNSALVAGQYEIDLVA